MIIKPQISPIKSNQTELNEYCNGSHTAPRSYYMLYKIQLRKVYNSLHKYVDFHLFRQNNVIFGPRFRVNVSCVVGIGRTINSFLLPGLVSFVLFFVFLFFVFFLFIVFLLNDEECFSYAQIFFFFFFL